MNASCNTLARSVDAFHGIMLKKEKKSKQFAMDHLIHAF